MKIQQWNLIVDNYVSFENVKRQLNILNVTGG